MLVFNGLTNQGDAAMNKNEVNALMVALKSESLAKMVGTWYASASRNNVNGHNLYCRSIRESHNASRKIKTHWYVDDVKVAAAKVADLILA